MVGLSLPCPGISKKRLVREAQWKDVYFLGVWHSLLVYKQTFKQRRAFMSCLVRWVTFLG